MPKLFVWSAYRSGASLTISHSAGRLAGFDRVYYCTARHKVIAAHKDGREFELAGVEGGTEVPCLSDLHPQIPVLVFPSLGQPLLGEWRLI